MHGMNIKIIYINIYVYIFIYFNSPYITINGTCFSIFVSSSGSSTVVQRKGYVFLRVPKIS